MSTMLCSLYLADLENKHLVPLLPDLLTKSNQASSSGPDISDLAALAGLPIDAEDNFPPTRLHMHTFCTDTAVNEKGWHLNGV